MKPTVSVVVVNLNRRDLLERCLESLWKQSYADFEAIVVDNGSTDNSLAFLQSIREARLQIVALDKNTGVAGGCNAGIARAEGRYVATWNNDSEAHQDWLRQFV